MSSSSLIYRIHAPEIHRQESQGYGLTCGPGCRCWRALAVFIASPRPTLAGTTPATLAAGGRGGVWSRGGRALGPDSPCHPQDRALHGLRHILPGLLSLRLDGVSGAASLLLRRLRAHGLAILSTFLVASADEFHQSFLPNRTVSSRCAAG